MRLPGLCQGEQLHLLVSFFHTSHPYFNNDLSALGCFTWWLFCLSPVWVIYMWELREVRTWDNSLKLELTFLHSVSIRFIDFWVVCDHPLSTQLCLAQHPNLLHNISIKLQEWCIWRCISKQRKVLTKDSNTDIYCHRLSEQILQDDFVVINGDLKTILWFALKLV